MAGLSRSNWVGGEGLLDATSSVSGEARYGDGRLSGLWPWSDRPAADGYMLAPFPWREQRLLLAG